MRFGIYEIRLLLRGLLQMSLWKWIFPFYLCVPLNRTSLLSICVRHEQKSVGVGYMSLSMSIDGTSYTTVDTQTMTLCCINGYEGGSG